MSDKPISVSALRRAMNTRKAKLNPHIAVAAWNNAVHVGQWVEYRAYPEAEPQLFKTRGPAIVPPAGYPVVWLAGKCGYVTCESCTPVEPPCTCLGSQLGPHYCERHAA